MTTFEMARRLNGNQYLNEITGDEECIAKESNLVIVFGYSDDCIEFRGAIEDELCCFNGGDFWINKKCVEGAYDGEAPDGVKTISAVWCGKSGAS